MEKSECLTDRRMLETKGSMGEKLGLSNEGRSSLDSTELERNVRAIPEASANLRGDSKHTESRTQSQIEPTRHRPFSEYYSFDVSHSERLERDAGLGRGGGWSQTNAIATAWWEQKREENPCALICVAIEGRDPRGNRMATPTSRPPRAVEPRQSAAFSPLAEDRSSRHYHSAHLSVPHRSSGRSDVSYTFSVRVEDQAKVTSPHSSPHRAEGGGRSPSQFRGWGLRAGRERAQTPRFLVQRSCGQSEWKVRTFVRQ